MNRQETAAVEHIVVLKKSDRENQDSNVDDHKDDQKMRELCSSFCTIPFRLPSLPHQVNCQTCQDQYFDGERQKPSINAHLAKQEPLSRGRERRYDLLKLHWMKSKLPVRGATGRQTVSDRPKRDRPAGNRGKDQSIDNSAAKDFASE